MKYSKYHALGNVYIVLDPEAWPERPSESEIRLICHRHLGVGSDGIFWGPLEAETADFTVRMFNPDGSEFEKSGNGLRIFSRYLWDKGLVREEPFTIDTAGGLVEARVHPGGGGVTVAMGQVSFDSRQIPVTGPAREVLEETLLVGEEQLLFCAATVGNPHCVVLRPAVTAVEAQAWGPAIEVDPRFPRRTNVQFMQVIDRANIRIEIWERGAGYTLASGSSSCAAAAVAHRLGLCDRDITVHMPGGRIAIAIGEDYAVTMTGAVTKVCEGVVAGEMLGGVKRET